GRVTPLIARGGNESGRRANPRAQGKNRGQPDIGFSAVVAGNPWVPCARTSGRENPHGRNGKRKGKTETGGKRHVAREAHRRPACVSRARRRGAGAGRVRRYAQRRDPALPDTPAMVELGKTVDARRLLALFGSTAEVGRALTAPPGLPSDRLAALRRGFAAMAADPAFKKELAKRNMEFDPLSGEELQRMIADRAKPGVSGVRPSP